MKVLIIDDDREDAQLLFEVIKELGLGSTCIMSHDYQSAKQVIDQEDDLDFIFLDAMMYPLGGKETLILLTQIEKLAETRIIVNCGMLSPSKVDDFLNLGADKVLQKPADHQSLTTKVKEILTE